MNVGNDIILYLVIAYLSGSLAESNDATTICDDSFLNLSLN